jgi:hypothetical protein
LQIRPTPFAFAYDAMTLPALMPRLGLCAGIADGSVEVGVGTLFALNGAVRKTARSQHTI